MTKRIVRIGMLVAAALGGCSTLYQPQGELSAAPPPPGHLAPYRHQVLPPIAAKPAILVAPFCREKPIDGRSMEMRCWAPWGDISDRESGYMAGMIIREAAQAALASGRDYFVLVSTPGVNPVTETSTTPIACDDGESVGRRALSALAVGLQALGNGMSSNGTANCNPNGIGGYNCDVNVPQQRPIIVPDERPPTCTGGDAHIQTIAWWYVQTFEILTAEEAEGRNDPLISPERRPISARLVLEQKHSPNTTAPKLQRSFDSGDWAAMHPVTLDPNEWKVIEPAPTASKH